MGKLSNEEIKWILNLEASGLQREIGKSTGVIKQLTQANKALQAEVDLANKFMKETERQMRSLERAGKENSSRYRELKGTYMAVRDEIDGYNERISENNDQIEKNNEIIKNGIQALKLEDMTMKQLKDRAKELKNNLDSTSKSANPEEYSKLEKEIGLVDDQMNRLSSGSKNTMKQLSSIPGPAGQVVNGLMGIGKAMKVILANPIGIVLTALVGIFMLFKKAINSSEQATFKLNQILAPLTALMKFLLKILQDVVIGFLNFTEKALNGVSKLLEKLPFVGEKMKEINEKAKEAIVLEKEKQQLERDSRAWTVERAKLENDIAKNRDKAYQKDKYSVKERLGYLDEALKAEVKISEENVRQAKEKLRIAKIEAARSGNTTEVEKELKELEAAVIQADTEMYEKRRGILEKRSAFIMEEKRNQEAAAKEALQKQKDTIDAQLNDLESGNNRRIAELKKSGIAQSKTENQINLEITRENNKFYQDRISALQEYLKKVKDEKLRSEIVNKISDNELAIVENQKQADTLKLAIVKEGLDKNLDMLEKSHSSQALVFEKALAQRSISQQQYDLLMQQLDASTADARVKIVEGYSEDVVALEIQSGDLKKNAVDEANKQVLESETESAQKRKAVYESIVYATRDFKDQFGLLSYDEEIALQTKILEDTYKARLEFLQKEGADTSELTAAFEQAKTNIILNSEKERFNARQQIGVSNWAQEFEIEKQNIDALHTAGLLAEEEYQEAIFNLKVDKAKSYYDYFKNLAVSAIDALQNAEISTMEATYQEKIKAAGDNADEVDRLENEAAQKKLDIQKKYADVSFAIKVSEIIASTAVAIMQAFEQLGPIAGAVAAVLMGATGAAQIVSANAERRKVKAMTLNSTASTSNTQTRVVTGKEEGGYVEVTREQDKKRFWAKKNGKKRGYIDQTSILVAENGKEFVGSAKAVSNPTIRPLFDMIDMAQRGGFVDQLNMDAILASSYQRGYQNGGYTASQSQYPGQNVIFNSAIDNQLLVEIRDFLSSLKRDGVKAPIVLSELQKQQALQELSNKMGSK